MTAVLTALDHTDVHVFRDDRCAPGLLVVLVAPTDELGQCDAAIDNAVLAGAVTFTCEVEITERMLATSAAGVLRAVDDASAAYPELPVVVVGHAAAGPIASMAADACANEIAGLVLTHPRAHPDPHSRAA